MDKISDMFKPVKRYRVTNLSMIEHIKSDEVPFPQVEAILVSPKKIEMFDRDSYTVYARNKKGILCSYETYDDFLNDKNHGYVDKKEADDFLNKQLSCLDSSITALNKNNPVYMIRTSISDNLDTVNITPRYPIQWEMNNENQIILRTANSRTKEVDYNTTILQASDFGETWFVTEEDAQRKILKNAAENVERLRTSFGINEVEKENDKSNRANRLSEMLNTLIEYEMTDKKPYEMIELLLRLGFTPQEIISECHFAKEDVNSVNENNSETDTEHPIKSCFNCQYTIRKNKNYEEELTPDYAYFCNFHGHEIGDAEDVKEEYCTEWKNSRPQKNR